MIADYHAELREAAPRADGVRHIDTPALIAKLQDLHVTAFYFLIHSQPSDWEDFRTEFVPAAQRADIDVWAYLVPPSECCANPFGNDYVRWATELAKLSVDHPNLKGFAIDDFQYNLKLYTPEYIGEVVRAARAVNPQFLFFPLLYFKIATDPKFLDAYAPVIDGVIMAYRDDPHTNTYRSTSFADELAKTEEMLAEHHRALVLMIYCHPLGRNPIPPSAAYIGKLAAAGLRDMRAGKLYGVVTYVLDKSGEPERPSLNRAHAGSGRATFILAGPIPQAGRTGDIAAALRVEPNAPAYALGFWYTHSAVKAKPGIYSVQALIDNHVVWQEDVTAGAPDQWRQVRVDVGGELKGRSAAELRFRVANGQPITNLEMNLGFDDIEGEGFRVGNPGFESQAGWTTHADTPAIFPLIDIFDPQRSIHAFRAVRNVYGPYSLVQRTYQSCAGGGMENKADTFLRTWEAGKSSQAAASASSLAEAANARGCAVLATQARRVAADLRGKS